MSRLRPLKLLPLQSPPPLLPLQPEPPQGQSLPQSHSNEVEHRLTTIEMQVQSLRQDHIERLKERLDASLTRQQWLERGLQLCTSILILILLRAAPTGAETLAQFLVSALSILKQ